MFGPLSRKMLGNLQVRALLVAQMVKSLLAMREIQISSRGWEDPLEKGTATHALSLAWKIP